MTPMYWMSILCILAPKALDNRLNTHKNVYALRRSDAHLHQDVVMPIFSLLIFLFAPKALDDLEIVKAEVGS